MGSFSYDVRLQLPSRLEVSDLVGLGEQLCVRYDAVASPAATPVQGAPVDITIPAPVAASWRRFIGSHDVLARSSALRRAAAPIVTDGADTAAANAASDVAWRTFESWLRTWSRHRDDGMTPSAGEAGALHGRLFPSADGMRFIKWKARRQWVAMQGRMTILDEAASVALVHGLGGARLLTALRDAHEGFGRAFGFTKVQVDAPAGVDLRPLFAAAKEALRSYATRVEGSADPDVAGSEALAAWLLAPLKTLVGELTAVPTPRKKKGVGKRGASQAPAPSGP